MRIGRTLLLVVLAGCAVEDWRNADLQLDIDGIVFDGDPTETRVRICVDGVGNEESALGAGRVAFPAIPADIDVPVTVDTLSDTADETRTGRAGPLTLDAATPYAATPWSACDPGDCAACQSAGDRAAAGDPDWLLAIRVAE